MASSVVHAGLAQKANANRVAAFVSMLVSAFMFGTFWNHLAEIRRRGCRCGTDLASYRYLTAIIVVHVVMSAMVSAAFALKSSPRKTGGLVASLAVIGFCEAIASFVWYYRIRRDQCVCARSWKNAAWVTYKGLGVTGSLVAVLGVIHLVVVVPFIARSTSSGILTKS